MKAERNPITLWQSESETWNSDMVRLLLGSRVFVRSCSVWETQGLILIAYSEKLRQSKI